MDNTTDRKPMGRPKKPLGEANDHTLQVRINRQQRQWLIEHARAVGGIADLIRSLIDDEMSRSGLAPRPETDPYDDLRF